MASPPVIVNHSVVRAGTAARASAAGLAAYAGTRRGVVIEVSEADGRRLGVDGLAAYAANRTGSTGGLWGADGPAMVPLTQGDAERLCWRLLATVAGEASAGEAIDVHIAREGARAIFAIELPASLAGASDIFSASLQSGQRTISAGMFGTGFTLRLARAEARAVGGSLSRDGDTLRLALPLLTGQDELPSHDAGNAAEGVGASPT